MHLGAFSMSLSVKDLRASMDFYKKLGFEVFYDQSMENWAILKTGDTVIGLFQGMFEGNMLTFNPGWDQGAQPVEPFTDIRAIQAVLTARGIKAETPVDPDGTGPAEFVITDPDGNRILIDQHVNRPDAG